MVDFILNFFLFLWKVVVFLFSFLFKIGIPLFLILVIIGAFIALFERLGNGSISHRNSSFTDRYTTRTTFSQTEVTDDIDRTFPPNINIFGQPENIDNILLEICKGEITDPYSQETFSPGQTIHFCLTHELAYHEDSWQEMGQKCDVCGHGRNTKNVTLPTPINLNFIDRRDEIQWRDRT